MFSDISRRRFLNHTALAGLGTSFAFLDALPAADTEKRGVAVAEDIEPLVRLIEDTPRDKLTEQIVARIHKGTSYHELLSALFLAGVRGIQPRPVGFKFHAVLVINSAHLAALSATDKDRWLPVLWAMDYYKAQQARNKAEGDWRMSTLDETKLPTDKQARQSFIDAMDTWDVDGADRAIAAWSRSGSAAEIFEPMWRYGSRDFRDIGHKAIYAANAWRTLQTIGWRHAEPVLRSLAYGMLDHEGTNPAKRDDYRDRPGRDNLERAEKMKEFRHAGKRDEKVNKEVLDGLRKASPEDASKLVAGLLEKKVHPGCIWEGLFLHAGELLMRQPGIVGLHTLTSLNAMHFAYQTSAVPTTRAYVLLQAAAFLTLFRAAMPGRGKMSDGKLDALEPIEVKEVGEIFADVSKDRMTAARKTLHLLAKSPRQLEPLMAGARRLIFAKGTDSHDYKFSSAVLEDAYSLAPALRPTFMAASMFYLKGSGEKDNVVVQKARAALTKGG